MLVLRRIEEVRQFVRGEKRDGRRVGFVPTMGYLHAGHLSLVHAVREDSDTVIASIFINPTQFGAGEDLETYPRDEVGDLEKLRAARCDAVFLPLASDMYPSGSDTRVQPGPISERLCGQSRPGHFDSVCTIVLKLLNIIECDVACFGEKDYQQLAIIRGMVRDLNVPVEIMSGPIVRESDGLAMSSRNVYLDREQRAEAPVLQASLQAARHSWMQGERDPRVLGRVVREILETSHLAQTDYVDVCCAQSLQPWPEQCEGPTLIALAVHFGSTRLIDNIRLTPESVQA